MPLSPEELRNRPEILARIDWDLTPQEVFQAYQIKSVDGWRQRFLPEVYYFHLSVFAGLARLLLVRKTYREAEEIALFDPPAELVEAALPPRRGKVVPRGLYALDEALKSWVKGRLGLVD